MEFGRGGKQEEYIIYSNRIVLYFKLNFALNNYFLSKFSYIKFILNIQLNNIH